MIGLLHLPPELHALIVQHLLVTDVLGLKLTCAYFYTLIPALSHAELLQAESTDWARHRDVFTCRYCLRLRPAGQFADRMLQRRRGRAGRNSSKRFCIECGLKPREGTARFDQEHRIASVGIPWNAWHVGANVTRVDVGKVAKNYDG